MSNVEPALPPALPAGLNRPADPADLPFVGHPGEKRGDMLYRPLGRSGETVSAIGMGGFHIGKSKLTDDAAVKLIHQAIDRGITFMDNCWDYNEGRSELRMGVALDQGGYRDKVYLMSKMDGRSKAEAADQIDTSLKRLRTDRIDLVQHHEILRYDDPDRIFGEGGAMEAFTAAQQAGKIRHIGFTGHKDPRIHLQMLDVAAERGFHFDAVQMPLNVMDAHFRSFAHLVLPYLVAHGIGVLGMKSFADSVLLEERCPDRADRILALLPEPADLGSDHRHRGPGQPRPGLRGRGELQADGQGRRRGTAVAVAALRDAWQVRTLQDELDVRRHGQEQRLAGR